MHLAGYSARRHQVFCPLAPAARDRPLLTPAPDMAAPLVGQFYCLDNQDEMEIYHIVYNSSCDFGIYFCLRARDNSKLIHIFTWIHCSPHFSELKSPTGAIAILLDLGSKFHIFLLFALGNISLFSNI